MPRCITLLLLVVLCSSLVDEGNAVRLPSRLDPTSEVLLQLKRYREAARSPVYSNDWAVQVYGGVETADEVAALHGFINMGKVKPKNLDPLCTKSIIIHMINTLDILVV